MIIHYLLKPYQICSSINVYILVPSVDEMSPRISLGVILLDRTASDDPLIACYQVYSAVSSIVSYHFNHTCRCPVHQLYRLSGQRARSSGKLCISSTVYGNDSFRRGETAAILLYLYLYLFCHLKVAFGLQSVAFFSFGLQFCRIMLGKT